MMMGHCIVVHNVFSYGEKFICQFSWHRGHLVEALMAITLFKWALCLLLEVVHFSVPPPWWCLFLPVCLVRADFLLKNICYQEALSETLHLGLRRCSSSSWLLCSASHKRRHLLMSLCLIRSLGSNSGLLTRWFMSPPYLQNETIVVVHWGPSLMPKSVSVKALNEKRIIVLSFYIHLPLSPRKIPFILELLVLRKIRRSDLPYQ